MFAQRLRALRRERSLTQQQFATALDVTQGTVGNWESGKREPGFEMMQRMADYFDVTVDYLLGREKEYTPQISGVYLSVAKEAQDRGIDPEDARKIIEMIADLSKKGKNRPL